MTEFFTIDNNSPAVIRFIPVKPASFALHTLKSKTYACSAFGKKDAFCPICQMRANLYHDAEEAVTEAKKRNFQDFARILRPIERHFLPIIDRAHPDRGVQILSASKFLYKSILDGWLTHPCPPPKPKWYHFLTRLYNWWYGIKQPMSALDEKGGVDFILRREMKRSGPRSFADFGESTYATEPSDLGTEADVALWKTQAQTALKEITFPSAEELSGHYPKL
jgi:hypothetical protein